MSDDNPRKARHVVITVALCFVVFAALYLSGFVVAVKLGPGLSPPISTVLSIVYWPLIAADENNALMLENHSKIRKNPPRSLRSRPGGSIPPSTKSQFCKPWIV